MKKRIVFVLTALLALTSVFASCSKPVTPLSKAVDTNNTVKVFSAFDSIGLEVESVFIDKDLSGYIEYIYFRSSSETLLTQLNNRVNDINKRAFTDEKDYIDGYRVIFYDEAHITTNARGVMSIKIQFTDINYLKSEISVIELSKYLETEDYGNNNFVTTNGDKVGLVNYEDTEFKYIITVTGAVNHVPITLNGTKILCYDGESDLVKIDKQTINFSNADFKVVFSVPQTPVLLIVIASIVVAVLIIAAVVRFVVLPRLRG